MRIILAFVLALYSAAALAQAGPPPTVGGKPLVQIKPRDASAKPAAAAANPAAATPKPKGPPQSIAKRLQACLDIDDGFCRTVRRYRQAGFATRRNHTSLDSAGMSR